jgi:hypothetical protein
MDQLPYSTQRLRAASRRVQSGTIRTIGRSCSQGDVDPNLQLVGDAVALWSEFLLSSCRDSDRWPPAAHQWGFVLEDTRIREVDLPEPMNPQSPLARPFFNFTRFVYRPQRIFP